MHELGIVTHTARTVSALAKENNLVKVGSVTLEVGEVSGIMTEYFIDCWNYFRKRYDVLQEAELRLETIKAVTYCSNCQKEYETVVYGRICPYCQSEKTWLLRGNECIIKEIEAE